MLILLNGPPASGKSTLAQRLVEHSPTMLNIDIDELRSQIPNWRADPLGSGLAARKQAIELARDHLAIGGDVVIPQFLGKVDFIEELADLAIGQQVPFVEVMLDIDRDVAKNAFIERGRDSETQSHQDAAFLVEMSSASDPLGDMFDAARGVLKTRPWTVVVQVDRADIDATFESLLAVLDIRPRMSTR